MHVRVWGCRGSLAAPGPDTVTYGGNTACVEVRLRDGTLIILDAGTGIRALGRSLERDPPREIHLLLSHLHLDHLVGLGFFAPLFTEGMDVHVWGPRSSVDSLEERILRYLSPPLFPVHLAEIAQARLQLHNVPEVEPMQVGSALIAGQPVQHQGRTLGFRIEEDGFAVAYIPDHEPALGSDLDRIELEWLSGYFLAARADVLFHDAQYTDAEYERHIGWGHSSIRHAVTLAKRAEVRELVLFHHDPLHSDGDLEQMLVEARTLWGPSGSPPVLAYEGLERALQARPKASSV